jgi:hypothetical protein
MLLVHSEKLCNPLIDEITITFFMITLGNPYNRLQVYIVRFQMFR